MTHQPQQPAIAADSISVISAPDDPGHRVPSSLSPLDPAVASALLSDEALQPALEPPPPAIGYGQLIESLLAPLGLETFVANHWEKSPALIRASEPRPRNLMFQRAELHAGVEQGRFAPASVSLSSRGALQSTASFTRFDEKEHRVSLDPGKVRSLIDSAGSIRVLDLQRYSTRVANMCRELGGNLGCRVAANVYYSAAGQGHFSSMRGGIHWDTHSVFALQTAGKKRWRVFQPVVEQPESHHRSFFFDIPEAEPILDVVLEEGDVLYLPRGFVHQVRSPPDSDSMHLAFGVYLPTWADLIDGVLKRAQLELSNRPSWRQAVDLNQPSDAPQKIEAMLREVISVAKGLDARAILEDTVVAQHQLAPSNPGPRPTLDTSSKVRRTELLCFVREESGQIAVKIPARKILFPVAARSLVQRLLETEPVQLGALATNLSFEEVKLVVEVLLFHGVLRLVEAGQPR